MLLKRDREVGVVPLDDELVIYSGRTHEVHILDPVSAFLWELCDGRHTADDLIDRLIEAAPDTPRETAAAVVSRTVAHLCRIRLILDHG